MVLKFEELYDPIQRTAVMEDATVERYAEINKDRPGKVDPGIIEQVRDAFYESHKDTETSFLDYMWALVSPRFSWGLVQFILDYHGAESNFFFPWLVEIGNSPSGALELAYGAGYDLAGNWVTKIPHSDPIDIFVRNDPALVYNRERQLATANLVLSLAVMRDPESEYRVKVVDFGAGRLAWARWHGLHLSSVFEEVLAFDKDLTIVPSELFDRDLKDLGITYRHGDLMSQLGNPACKDADAIILGGVATYFQFDVFAEAVLKPVYRLLGKHGIFFFDLQLGCPVFRRNASIFGWPTMNLPSTAAEAIAMVEKVRQRLWKSGVKYSAEYSLDTYNASPTALMITFAKNTT